MGDSKTGTAFELYKGEAKIASKQESKAVNYLPRRFKNVADREFGATINNFRANSGNYIFGKRVEDLTALYIYCNGTLQGQIGRNKKVLATQSDIDRHDDSYEKFELYNYNPIGLSYKGRFTFGPQPLMLPSFHDPAHPENIDLRVWCVAF